MEKTIQQRLKQNSNIIDEIIRIVTLYPRNFITVLKSKGIKKHSSNNEHLIKYIMDNTRCLDDDDFVYSLKTRLYWILNGIKDWNDKRVKCVVCGKQLRGANVDHLKSGYKRQTCCKICERTLAKMNNEHTLLEKYGVKNVFQIETIKRHLTARKNEIQEKREQTKRNHRTFKTSNKEEEAYAILCNFFDKDDIIRQYKSERYPFNCDFYVKSIDTYIECNFSWTHGGHWFNENNENDQRILQKWKDKHSKYYDNAIETWTVRDVKKRRCAKEKCLKYIVFWHIDDIRKMYR